MTSPGFPLMALSRHRLGTDGRGVTTLVAAHGCPLACRMCLNPQCRDPLTPVTRLSPQALYDQVRVDDLYFQATGGGVTFGGGEPLCHAAFIEAFRRLCGRRWRILAETSLHISPADLEIAIGCVDEFWVDIKDMDPAIYHRYTGADNGPVKENLKRLLDAVGPERVTVRVPHIPGFNRPQDVENSVSALREMGADKLDVFPYRLIDDAPPSASG
ncbi:MAG: radical SAM protein [Clostridia bacterium]|nr:radical SAM protein [Clostridia bacterium]